MMKVFLVLVVCIHGIVEAGSLLDTPGVTPVEALIAPIQKLRGVDAVAKALGLKKPFSLEDVLSEDLPGAVTRHRLALLYNDLRVLVFTIQATSDADGYFTGSASGYIPTISNLDTSVKVSVKDLKQATADYVNSKNIRQDIGNIAAKDVSRFTATKAIHVDKLTGVPRVVYFCEGVVDTIPSYNRWPRVLFDALTLRVIIGSVQVRYADNDDTLDVLGSILGKGTDKSCPSIQGGNQKYPFPVYGPGRNQVCLNAEVKGKKCSLANKRVTIKSLENGMDVSKAKVVSFKCEDGLSDGINGASSPASDAYYYGQKFYDFLEEWGNVDTKDYDPIDIFVHYGNNFDNSFFDGASIYLGDGSSLLFPLASPEIIAHELCHRETARFGNLKFESESLAIDESHSDICGRAFSAYLQIVADDNWDFGANIVKQSNLALRYFDDPTRDNWSIKNVNDFDRTTNPFQAVGIFNSVYNSLVEQHNFSHRDAFRTFLLANRLYWQEETDFQNGACGVKRAAKDLRLNVAAVDSAFGAVGIPLTSCSTLGGGR
ncbi:unnamed protein product [Lymnaea stagnalis]|uniref:Neutral metalloproteinase n=1 Tax=Lymnaea stagnalis TaxID=6523 RepID=A0AAV2IFL9_LYMST